MMMSDSDSLTSRTPTTLPVIRRFDGNGGTRDKDYKTSFAVNGMILMNDLRYSCSLQNVKYEDTLLLLILLLTTATDSHPSMLT